MPTDTALKVEAEDLKVEIEVVPCGACEEDSENNAPEISNVIRELDAKISQNQGRVDELSKEIDRLTSHADGIDYSFAVASGVICGLVDSFFVGEFDWGNAKKWSYQKVNKFVRDYAHKQGYTGESRRLKDHINFLQNKFKIPSDNLWTGKDAGIWTKSHHLDDWSHHPTPLGWICSVLTQFTRKGYFTNSAGEGFTWDVEVQELIGGTFAEKISAGTFNWFGHLISDVAGSSSSSGVKGMGLPGPLVSLVKEFSSLPGINKTKLPKLINDIFVKEKFDLRKELAVAHELGRQAIPVLINEILVRLFYFLRRLVQEWREYGFSGIHWRKTLPFKNRTTIRMMTVASATFTAVDMADAAIRAGIKTGGEPAAFWTSFVLRVNFVGIGRLAVAVVTDVGMGVKLGRRRWERIVAMNEQLHLLNAKVSIKDADMWMSAKATGEEIVRLYEKCADAQYEFRKAYETGRGLIEETRALRSSIEDKNPGLAAHLADLLDDL